MAANLTELQLIARVPQLDVIPAAVVSDLIDQADDVFDFALVELIAPDFVVAEILEQLLRGHGGHRRGYGR